MSKTIEVDRKIYNVERVDSELADFAFEVTGPRKFSLSFHGEFIDPENVSLTISDGFANGNGIFCKWFRFAPKNHMQGRWWVDHHFGLDIKREKDAGYFDLNVTENVANIVLSVVSVLVSEVAPEFADQAQTKAMRADLKRLEGEADRLRENLDAKLQEVYDAQDQLNEWVASLD